MSFVMPESATTNKGGGDIAKEEKFIPAGDTAARLVGVIELGRHHSYFGKNPDGTPKRAVYDKSYGKIKKGDLKPDVYEIQTLWATGCEHTGPDPLYLMGGDFERVKVPAFAWEDPTRLTMKMQIVKLIMQLREITNVKNGCSLKEFMGEVALFPVTNKPNTKSDIEGMMYANTKFNLMRGTAVVMNGKVVADFADGLPEMGDGEDDFKPMFFSWSNPTKEDFMSVKPWHRKRMLMAEDYKDGTAPLCALIAGDKELQELIAPNDDDEKVPAGIGAASQGKAEEAPEAPPLSGPAGAAAILLAQQKAEAEKAAEENAG